MRITATKKMKKEVILKLGALYILVGKTAG